MSDLSQPARKLKVDLKKLATALDDAKYLLARYSREREQWLQFHSN